MIKQFANLDGFRVYKIKNRKDVGATGKEYIAPVYVIGLPGDVDNLNKEIDALTALVMPLVGPTIGKAGGDNIGT